MASSKVSSGSICNLFPCAFSLQGSCIQGEARAGYQGCPKPQLYSSVPNEFTATDQYYFHFLIHLTSAYYVTK